MQSRIRSALRQHYKMKIFHCMWLCVLISVAQYSAGAANEDRGLMLKEKKAELSVLNDVLVEVRIIRKILEDKVKLKHQGSHGHQTEAKDESEFKVQRTLTIHRNKGNEAPESNYQKKPSVENPWNTKRNAIKTDSPRKLQPVQTSEPKNPPKPKDNNETKATYQPGKCGKEGFIHLSDDLPCVRLYEEWKNWDDAMKTCRSQNAALLKVDSAKKQKDVTQFLKSHKSFGIWIGARDLTSTNMYEWYDKSPMEYTAWAPRQPTHGFLFQKEDCVQIQSIFKFKWLDRPCHVLYSFMCESKQ